eukprot:gene8046-5599_t
MCATVNEKQGNKNIYRSSRVDVCCTFSANERAIMVSHPLLNNNNKEKVQSTSSSSLPLLLLVRIIIVVRRLRLVSCPILLCVEWGREEKCYN